MKTSQKEKIEELDFTNEVKEVEEEGASVAYKSKLLNRYFDSIEELREEEEKYRRENDEKLKAIQKKKDMAKAVEKAYANYKEVLKKCTAELTEAEENYKKVLDEFIKEYGSYHQSYYYTDDSNTFDINSLFKLMFDSFNI